MSVICLALWIVSFTGAVIPRPSPPPPIQRTVPATYYVLSKY